MKLLIWLFDILIEYLVTKIVEIVLDWAIQTLKERKAPKLIEIKIE